MIAATGGSVVARTLARDPRLGRVVAIKVISQASGSDLEHLRRFEPEALAVSVAADTADRRRLN
jgi:hypothetical protein